MVVLVVGQLSVASLVVVAVLGSLNLWWCMVMVVIVVVIVVEVMVMRDFFSKYD